MLHNVYLLTFVLLLPRTSCLILKYCDFGDFNVFFILWSINLVPTYKQNTLNQWILKMTSANIVPFIIMSTRHARSWALSRLWTSHGLCFCQVAVSGMVICIWMNCFMQWLNSDCIFSEAAFVTFGHSLSISQPASWWTRNWQSWDCELSHWNSKFWSTFWWTFWTTRSFSRTRSRKWQPRCSIFLHNLSKTKVKFEWYN